MSEDRGRLGRRAGRRAELHQHDPGLGMARQMVDDLRELEPTAWAFWQPVEDYNNMKPGGEFPTGGTGAASAPVQLHRQGPR
jgi:hypothetical protein